MSAKSQMIKIVQPANLEWSNDLSKLANDGNLAVVVVNPDSKVIYEANNNSICKTLYSSEQFAPECNKYCGKAFELVKESGTNIEYECYAGLDCIASPIIAEEKVQLVSIVGRAFTKASKYREATERAITGNWKSFPPTKIFENVLLRSAGKDLQIVADKIINLSKDTKKEIIEFETEISGSKKEITGISSEAKKKSVAENELFQQPGNDLQTDNLIIDSTESVHINNEEIEEFAAWRSHFGSIFTLSHIQACQSVLDFLSQRHSIDSIAWAEVVDNKLETILANGKFRTQKIKINIPAYSKHISLALEKESSVKIELKNNSFKENNTMTIHLFPTNIGGEFKGGLIIEKSDISEKLQQQLIRFCRNISPEIEILRLRGELERRKSLETAVKKINNILNDIDSEDFWVRLTQIFAELMRAEKCSLLLVDDKTENLVYKSAIGNYADDIREQTDSLGDRIAKKVIANGKALVSENINQIGIKIEKKDWDYSTNSFICYPLNIGSKKIGVLNLTDKIDREPYNQLDLQILDSIMPQLAVLIDRAAIKSQAGEFEQLSLTDVLTGLLNRRYLEERLGEEIRRSNREGFPMSFMMIDVDDFKSYNDNFSHPEGDKALKIVAKRMKETLRGADVAARYGGEEFSILLPQTNIEEARAIAERIRENVQNTKFEKRPVTISIGIASCSRVICNAQEIVAAADKALYKAKNSGRNNVQIYDDSFDEGKKNIIRI